MYLFSKYTVFVILSYQCITTYSFEHEKAEDQSRPAGKHCVVLILTEEKYFMPIPYQLNVSGPAVITPDRDGHLFVANGRHFRFSCSGGTFVSPTDCVGLAEVTVRCVNGNTLGHKGREYEFDEFRCDALPRAKLTAANASCNGIANGVFDVGFYTAEPLTLYRVCFDAGLKRTLYSWNYVDAPAFHIMQIVKTVPRFVETEHFKSVDMADVYDPKERNESKSLGKTSMTADKTKSEAFSFIPGHLLTRNQFVYSFQQFATYFYENTAPQWSVFGTGIWNDVDWLSLRNLNYARGKHLIITGTINSTNSIHSRTDAQKPFDHQWLNGIPVPHSFWRMVYDVRNNKGVVYIGLNRPLTSDDSTKHFCEKIPCPGKLGRQITVMDLVYCCSKESFEKFYGPLDPVVFEEF